MIEFRNVSYSYRKNGGKNIDDLNFTIHKGEFVLITGRSGSGKTTVSKCINGLIPYFHEGIMAGDVFVGGENTKGLALYEIGEKVGSVFQDPRSQFFTTNTTDEVAFGCQNLGMERGEILQRITDAFYSLKIGGLRDRSIFELSSGEKKKIAIASCRAMNPCVYVLDEPSANLDIESIDQLGKILHVLKNSGTTIVVIEHRLYYLRELVDRILYMDGGKITGTYAAADIEHLNSEKLAAMGLRHFNLADIQYCAKRVAKNRDIALTVANLEFAYKRRKSIGGTGEILRNVGFTAWGGEIIGLTGKNGAGKTTLAKVLAGLLKEKSGSIAFNDRRLRPKDRLRKTYFVMQDSDYQLFSDSVKRELELGNEQLEGLPEKCHKVLGELDLLPYEESHPAALSRGQKQRLTIGNGIICGADVIFYDEPTSGLDAENMKKVVKLLTEQAGQGKLVFIISHDYEFLLNICSRILHLQDGIIANDFELEGINEPRLKKLLFT